MAGRPRTSVEVKQLHGTLRRDRQQVAPTRNALPLLAQIPDPPARFDGNPRAAYQWRFVCEELHTVGLLRPIMLDWIELYCLYLSDCFRFRDLAESEGWVTQYQDESGTVTGESISKYAALSDTAYTKAQQTLKLLCLDPATVARLSPPAAEKPQSKLQQLMNKGK